MKKRTLLRGAVRGAGEVGAAGDGVVQEGISDEGPLSQNLGEGSSFPLFILLSAYISIFLIFSLILWDSCSPLLFFKLKLIMEKLPWEI